MAACSLRLAVACPYSHLYRNPQRPSAGCATIGPSAIAPHPTPNSVLPGYRCQVSGRLSRLKCFAASETLYEVLGVAESATKKEIKAAYRKKAMKLHPDVNEAPNAKEQFMQCKTAYDTLIDEQSRAAYDRARAGGFASGIGGDFGTDWDSFGKYARSAAQSTKYTYSDLMRDLDKELEAWQRERERKKGRRAEAPADILTDIADEFLDFLEMGAGLGSDENAKARRGAASSSSGASSYSSGTSSRQSDSAGSGGGSGPRPGTRSTGTQTEADADTAFRRAAEAAEREAEAARQSAARSAAAAQERARREAERAADIEDELAALKRKLGR